MLILKLYRERKLANIKGSLLIERTIVAEWVNMPQIITQFDLDYRNMINDEVTPEYARVETSPDFLWDLMKKCEQVLFYDGYDNQYYCRDTLPINDGLEGEELGRYNEEYYAQVKRVVDDLKAIHSAHYEGRQGIDFDRGADDYLYTIIR
jgi:hypothetical protein